MPGDSNVRVSVKFPDASVTGELVPPGGAPFSPVNARTYTVPIIAHRPVFANGF